MKKWLILFVIFAFLFSGAVMAFSEPQEQEAMTQEERLMQNILQLDQKLQEALKNQQQEAVILLNNQLQEAKKKYELYLKEEKAKENFEGFGWGVGSCMMFMQSDEQLIDEAKLDENNVIRIVREGTIVPSFMLEAHRFWPLDKNKTIGLGPFVGMITNPSGDLFDALALGGMIGFRRLGEADDNSLNFGVGWVWNRNAKVLGPGAHENEPLPPGITEIPIKYKTLGGICLMISFAF